MILALDPGTKCGWALRRSNLTYQSGVWFLAPRRREGAGMRFVRLREYLVAMLEANPRIRLVAYEQVQSHKGTAAAHIYGGLVATIQAVCEDRRVKYRPIPVQTIKRQATGRGGVDKDAMIAAALRFWPELKSIDDNEADARWIAETAAALIRRPSC